MVREREFFLGGMGGLRRLGGLGCETHRRLWDGWDKWDG